MQNCWFFFVSILTPAALLASAAMQANFFINIVKEMRCERACQSAKTYPSQVFCLLFVCLFVCLNVCVFVCEWCQGAHEGFDE